MLSQSQYETSCLSICTVCSSPIICLIALLLSPRCHPTRSSWPLPRRRDQDDRKNIGQKCIWSLNILCEFCENDCCCDNFLGVVKILSFFKLAVLCFGIWWVFRFIMFSPILEPLKWMHFFFSIIACSFTFPASSHCFVKLCPNMLASVCGGGDDEWILGLWLSLLFWRLGILGASVDVLKVVRGTG